MCCNWIGSGVAKVVLMLFVGGKRGCVRICWVSWLSHVGSAKSHCCGLRIREHRRVGARSSGKNLS